LLLFANHTAMLVLSVALIAVVGRGDFARFGFRYAGELPLRQIIVWGLAIGAASTLIVAMAPGKDVAVATDLSFPETVVFIWLWASLCEEVLVRGLVQTSLAGLSGHGLAVLGVRVSAPVIIAAVVFALLHLASFAMGAHPAKALAIVPFALALGLVAGHYRELSGSLVPAVVVHALANVGGSLADKLIAAVG